TILGKVIDSLNLNTEWGKRYAGGEKLKTVETMMLLKRHMDLNPVRNTSFIEITVRSEDSNEAARIANAIAETYRDERLEERRQLSLGGIKTLDDRFNEQEQKIRAVQEEADALRKKLEITDVEAAGTAPTPLLEADTLRRFETLRIEEENA